MGQTGSSWPNAWGSAASWRPTRTHPRPVSASCAVMRSVPGWGLSPLPVWPSALLSVLSLQLAGGSLGGLLEALDSMGLHNAVRMLHKTEALEKLQSTGTECEGWGWWAGSVSAASPVAQSLRA